MRSLPLIFSGSEFTRPLFPQVSKRFMRRWLIPPCWKLREDFRDHFSALAIVAFQERGEMFRDFLIRMVLTILRTSDLTFLPGISACGPQATISTL